MRGVARQPRRVPDLGGSLEKRADGRLVDRRCRATAYENAEARLFLTIEGSVSDRGALLAGPAQMPLRR